MMNRLKFLPMAITGVSALLIMSGIILSGFIFEGGAACIALGGILLTATVISKRLREVTVLFYLSAALLFSGLMLSGSNQCSFNQAKMSEGKDVTVTATVTGEVQSGPSKIIYILKTESVADNEIEVKFRLMSNCSLGIYAGDVISFSADVYSVDKLDSSLKRYYMSEGIYLGSNYYDGEENITLIKDGSNTLDCKLQLLRDEIKGRIYSFLPNEYGAVAVAILLGDSYGVSDETVANFKISGVSHLFAVSGLHLSVWVMSLFYFLRKLGISKRTGCILTVFFIVFFMMLSGFSPSVTRAGVMLLATQGGVLIKRERNALNSLGFALILILVFNPMAAASVSLWLSFSATLGIITMYPKIEEAIQSRIGTARRSPFKKLLIALVSVFFVSVVAVLFTFPVSCFTFGGISIAGPVTNVLVSHASTVMMITAGMTALFYSVAFLGNFFALVCGFMAKYVVFITEKIGDIPFAMVEVEFFILVIFAVLIISAVVCSLILFRQRSQRIKAVVASALILCIIFGCTGFIYNHNLTKAAVIDVDDGICMVIEKSGERLVLGCGGSEHYAQDKIANEIFGNKASVLIVPDSRKWNSSLSESVSNLVSFERIISGEEIKGVDSTVESDFTLSPWDSGNIEFHKTESLCYAYCIFESTDMLVIFTCDENAQINEHLDADILICSYYLPESLDLSGFGNIIISSSPEVSEDMVKRYSSNNSNVYSTYGETNLIINMKNSKQADIISG